MRLRHFEALRPVCPVCRGRDDFAPLTLEEYRALPGWRKLLERVYRSPFGVGVAYVFDFYCNYLLFPAPANRSHR